MPLSPSLHDATGTTLADSAVATGHLLRAKIYPESDDGNAPLGDGPDGIYERTEHTYNRPCNKLDLRGLECPPRPDCEGTLKACQEAAESKFSANVEKAKSALKSILDDISESYDSNVAQAARRHGEGSLLYSLETASYWALASAASSGAHGAHQITLSLNRSSRHHDLSKCDLDNYNCVKDRLS